LRAKAAVPHIKVSLPCFSIKARGPSESKTSLLPGNSWDAWQLSNLFQKAVFTMEGLNLDGRRVANSIKVLDSMSKWLLYLKLQSFNRHKCLFLNSQQSPNTSALAIGIPIISDREIPKLT